MKRIFITLSLIFSVFSTSAMMRTFSTLKKAGVVSRGFTSGNTPKAFDLISSSQPIIAQYDSKRDRADLYDILEDTVGLVYSAPYTAEQYIQDLEADRHYTTEVMRLADKTAGFIHYSIDNKKIIMAHVAGLAIARNFRKGGYGKSLLQHVISIVKGTAESKEKSFEIGLEVYSDNTFAQNAYRKIGFSDHNQSSKLIHMKYCFDLPKKKLSERLVSVFSLKNS